MEIIIVGLGAAIATIGWLYQKAWERHERRVSRYENVMVSLTGHSAARRDPEAINAAIAIYHELWIAAPDEVVLAFRKYYDLSSNENFHKTTNEERAQALGSLVISMRKDASTWKAMWPRPRTALKPEDFMFMAGVDS